MRLSREMRLHHVGGSLRLTIPMEIVKAFRLTVEDLVQVESNESAVTLKFFKVTKTRTPVLVGDAVQEEASAG
jgi:antitoxin component of MazEF toxin-antitoxin module